MRAVQETIQIEWNSTFPQIINSDRSLKSQNEFILKMSEENIKIRQAVNTQSSNYKERVSVFVLRGI